jgi:hypothetical protein
MRVYDVSTAPARISRSASYLSLASTGCKSDWGGRHWSVRPTTRNESQSGRRPRYVLDGQTRGSLGQ